MPCSCTALAREKCGLVRISHEEFILDSPLMPANEVRFKRDEKTGYS